MKSIPLIEHHKDDYPVGMYRQPRDVFYHVPWWVGPCSLCDYDKTHVPMHGCCVRHDQEEAAYMKWYLGNPPMCDAE